MEEVIYYEISHDDRNSWLGNERGIFKFKTRGEAIDVATEFKKNPKSHNENMSDENIEYWKNETYIVYKITKSILELDKI